MRCGMKTAGLDVMNKLNSAMARIATKQGL